MGSEFTVAYRLTCADCGTNADLMKCFVTRKDEDGEEYEYDFELCQECIEKREDDSENKTQDTDERADFDADNCLGDCGE